MLRFIYRWLIGLHPRRFKRRFGDEMLSIFDEAQGKGAAAKLLGDGAVSVVRQWALSSEFSEEPLAGAPVHRAHDRAPTFCIVDDSLPHARALMNGTVLSFAVFSVICFAMIYDQNHVVLKPLFSVPFDFSPPASLPERSAVRPTVRLKRRLEDQPAAQPGSARKAPETQPATAPKVPASPPAPQAVTPTSAATSPKLGRMSNPESRERKLAIYSLSPSRHGPGRYAGTWILEKIPRRVLRSYSGTYVPDAQDGLKLSVRFESDELRFEIQGEENRTLLPVSETEFIVKDAPDCWVEFSKNQDGTVQLDFYDNSRHLTARRQPGGS